MVAGEVKGLAGQAENATAKVLSTAEEPAHGAEQLRSAVGTFLLRLRAV